jgi:hypothetical protein
MDKRQQQQEQQKEIDIFLAFVDKEIEQWGIYKNSPELQKIEKDKIITGLLKLPELQKTVMIPKLIQSGIFTSSEIDKAFLIPTEKRKLLNFRELLESDIPDEEMLVGRGLIPKTGKVIICGLAKEGKTLLSLQLALNLVSGTHFLEDFPVIKKCRVLYIYRENTWQGLKKIGKMQVTGLKNSGLNIDKKDKESFYLWDGREFMFTLKHPNLEGIKKAIDEARPDVIFLDPISEFLSFVDLNKAENAKRFTDLLREIKDCCWILLHHYRKPSLLAKGESDIAPIYRMYGSSYLANSCESFIGLEREGQNYPTDYKKIYFVLRKEEEPEPMHLKRDSRTLIYEVKDSVDLIRGRVSKEDIVRILERSFKGKASYKDLVSLCSDQFEVKESRIANLLKELKEAGIIAKEEGKSGCWYIKKLFPNLFK